MKFPKRKQQTQIKHFILQQYLDSWAGIIFHGLLKRKKRNTSNNFILHFNYIDLFASEGYYECDECEKDSDENLVLGSPPIGIECLKKIQQRGNDFGLNVNYNCILSEIKMKKVEKLYWGLTEFSKNENVKIVDNCNNIVPNQISIINDDYQNHVDDLIEFMNQRICFTFVFIDPYGIKDIPMDIISRFVNHSKTDTMINFPLLDVYRKSGYLHNTSQSGLAKSNLTNIDNLYGFKSWREIIDYDLLALGYTKATWLMEQTYTDYYTACLIERAPDKAIKHISLKIPQKDRILYNLVLTTSDPSGTMVMNKILRDANQIQEYLDEKNRLQKLIEKDMSSAQSSLFNADQMYGSLTEIEKPKRITVSKESIAKEIYSVFAGKTVTIKNIYQHFGFHTGYITSELKSGLSLLKRQKRASYDSLYRNSDHVQFK